MKRKGRKFERSSQAIVASCLSGELKCLATGELERVVDLHAEMCYCVWGLGELSYDVHRREARLKKLREINTIVGRCGIRVACNWMQEKVRDGGAGFGVISTLVCQRRGSLCAAP